MSDAKDHGCLGFRACVGRRHKEKDKDNSAAAALPRVGFGSGAARAVGPSQPSKTAQTKRPQPSTAAAAAPSATKAKDITTKATTTKAAAPATTAAAAVKVPAPAPAVKLPEELTRSQAARAKAAGACNKGGAAALTGARPRPPLVHNPTTQRFKVETHQGLGALSASMQRRAEQRAQQDRQEIARQRAEKARAKLARSQRSKEVAAVSAAGTAPSRAGPAPVAAPPVLRPEHTAKSTITQEPPKRPAARKPVFEVTKKQELPAQTQAQSAAAKKPEVPAAAPTTVSVKTATTTATATATTATIKTTATASTLVAIRAPQALKGTSNHHGQNALGVKHSTVDVQKKLRASRRQEQAQRSSGRCQPQPLVHSKQSTTQNTATRLPIYASHQCSTKAEAPRTASAAQTKPQSYARPLASSNQTPTSSAPQKTPTTQADKPTTTTKTSACSVAAKEAKPKPKQPEQARVQPPQPPAAAIHYSKQPQPKQEEPQHKHTGSTAKQEQKTLLSSSRRARVVALPLSRSRRDAQQSSSRQGSGTKLNHFVRARGQAGRRAPTKALRENQLKLAPPEQMPLEVSLARSKRATLKRSIRKSVRGSAVAAARVSTSKLQQGPVLEFNTPPRALLVVRQQSNKSKTVTVRRARLEPASVCASYAYILDDVPAQRCVLFVGAAANKHVVMYAVKLWEDIRRNERQGRPVLVRVDERAGGQGYNADERRDLFWRALGGRGDEAAAAAPDEELQSTLEPRNELYRCEADACAEGGYKLVSLGTPSRWSLRSDGCYVLDAYTEVFVWLGSAAPRAGRRMLFTAAAELGLAARARPAWVQRVDLLTEGSESELFKAKLPDWLAPQQRAQQDVLNKIFRDGLGRSVADAHFDALAMLEAARPQQLEHRFEGDETEQARGTIAALFRVHQDTMVAVDEACTGHFWDGESYVVLYKYPFKNTLFYATYFWQGRHSTTVDKGRAAALAVDLATKLKIDSTQLRVPQGKEPAHLLRVFGGHLVVHRGRQPERYVLRQARCGRGGAAELYRVCPSYRAGLCVLTEVPPRAALLDSNACFVVLEHARSTPAQQTLRVWRGRHHAHAPPATDALVQRFGQLASLSGATVVAVEHTEQATEAAERATNRSFYAALEQQQQDGGIRQRCEEPRVWCCSCAEDAQCRGAFSARPVPLPAVEDLDSTHTALVDTGSGLVFAWLGSHSSWVERMCVVRAAIKYCDLPCHKSRPRARVLMQGCEHAEPLFARAFPGSFLETEQQQKQQQKGEPSVGAEEFLASVDKKYTLEELREASNPMRFIDGKNLEQYLADNDFERVLGMGRTQFKRLPRWKRDELKRKVGLF